MSLRTELRRIANALEWRNRLEKIALREAEESRHRLIQAHDAMKPGALTTDEALANVRARVRSGKNG